MESFLEQYVTVNANDTLHWYKAASITDFPRDGGACIKYKEKQIAVFNFSMRNKWYACQNLCPHKMEMVLARGIIGDANNIPKVVCPLHKRNFSLDTGENLNGEEESITIYPVKIEDGFVYIGFQD
ncbi:MAG: nitrite reductase small subunit NirD [Saprospiraceae bacterium]|nr:nitrite reductase small subunit NirD [Saprospiraceae bacterium]